VGAISNPGLSALEAALSPANTNYLFMLKLDETPAGHMFFETRAEYNAARAALDSE
jgi:cell division protein YceG involved in septum cleavage